MVFVDGDAPGRWSGGVLSPSGRDVFARFFQRHPFVRGFVLRRDRRRCKLCGRPIRFPEGGWHVHHWDYEHECVRPALRKIWAPVVTRNGCRDRDCIATRVVALSLPDCERCFAETPLAFGSCASRVCAAHAGCNREHG